MQALAHWLSESSTSAFMRAHDWLIPLLQTIHILSIAMLMSSLLLIDLRLVRTAAARSMQDTVHRFEAWIWTGLALLAVSGAPLIVAEPQRTLPNVTFQTKMILLVFAAAATLALAIALRRSAGFQRASSRYGAAARALGFGALALWCAVAAAGRFIAYTQPG